MCVCVCVCVCVCGVGRWTVISKFETSNSTSQFYCQCCVSQTTFLVYFSQSILLFYSTVAVTVLFYSLTVLLCPTYTVLPSYSTSLTSYCLTVLLSYFPTVLLSHCLTADCLTVLLSYCLTVLLS